MIGHAFVNCKSKRVEDCFSLFIFVLSLFCQTSCSRLSGTTLESNYALAISNYSHFKFSLPYHQSRHVFSLGTGLSALWLVVKLDINIQYCYLLPLWLIFGMGCTIFLECQFKNIMAWYELQLCDCFRWSFAFVEIEIEVVTCKHKRWMRDKTRDSQWERFPLNSGPLEPEIYI